LSGLLIRKESLNVYSIVACNPVATLIAHLYSSRYFHVLAPSNVLILVPAMSVGDIILALTAIRPVSDLSMLS